MNQGHPSGIISWISGPVARVDLSESLSISEQVHVGEHRLTAEVISVSRDQATLQVYEETAGLGLGEPVYGTGSPLSVQLGPGLIGRTFDGIQRPLRVLYEEGGLFIQRGKKPPALAEGKQWLFSPAVEEGEALEGGDLFGRIPESELIEHRLLVPPGKHGRVVEVAPEGDYALRDTLLKLEDQDGNIAQITGMQRWPVRRGRPFHERRPPSVPLITGQRVIDSFFPLAKGGTASIPGPFGSGKTVMQHNLAKWSDADLIVYVGCGERGNEMSQVLEEFPELEDPWTGQPLMERTILIANTSNMPVAAREASIYTGLTIAEYYRDQGYDVALMADSTSRWAEALREISGRLEEMPAEEGFPAYLPTRLAAFYERAGRIHTLGGKEGSVTIVGAVSPPGGDFSEPVTRHTQRFTRCFWALDRELANQRHYPAISWLDSYSLYQDRVASWWEEELDADWIELRRQAMAILQEEADLQQIVELVGPEALANLQRWTLATGRLLKEGFLQQNAFSEVDAYAVPEKQLALLSMIVELHHQGRQLVEKGIPYSRVREVLPLEEIVRLKDQVGSQEVERIDRKAEQVISRFEKLDEEVPPSTHPGTQSGTSSDTEVKPDREEEISSGGNTSTAAEGEESS